MTAYDYDRIFPCYGKIKRFILIMRQRTAPGLRTGSRKAVLRNGKCKSPARILSVEPCGDRAYEEARKTVQKFIHAKSSKRLFSQEIRQKA